ncbi:unnamed protein product [Dovyalis caffra]|uniref:Uncharacterized protein n=1 Tax=Dovyalis caffra TaxID=77055 RepID=A0AAV1S713_9ROSI|nr:unnamed protein product [Dovyalis caffra]
MLHQRLEIDLIDPPSNIMFAIWEIGRKEFERIENKDGSKTKPRTRKSNIPLLAATSTSSSQSSTLPPSSSSLTNLAKPTPPLTVFSDKPKGHQTHLNPATPSLTCTDPSVAPIATLFHKPN